LDTVEHPGRVFLVGAGPGDPGLLTARALELIASADVILYDRLIPAQALQGAKNDAELVFVGKQGGGESVPQQQTESLLLRYASEGKRVVRLKGGDPFVFGRGGEEALVLAAAGIPFEVVPGVTSGVAAAAYAGIPVTHRGQSIAVALVTGHEDPGKDEMALDWPALAAFPGTLVFYMGIRQLSHITQSLIAGGRSASEPAAVIEQGTLPSQRTVTGTLASIAEVAQQEDVRPPSITVVGAVAALSQKLSWLAPRPLRGFSVVVTRARPQASDLARRLTDLGADVLQTPVIRIQAIEQPPIDPGGYDLVCLMSPNAVEQFFQSLAAGGRDARTLAETRVAAIGPGTARALTEHGIAADLIPERFVAEGLIEALAGIPVHRALIVCARAGREVLAEELRARDAHVDVVELYETVAEPLSEHALKAALSADYITFTSSSTVRFFMQAAANGEISPATRIVSIGPATSQTLREYGSEHHLQAASHDIDGLIEVLLGDAESRER
jgi:uroporphyrinogen III methyltransferase / synthase